MLGSMLLTGKPYPPTIEGPSWNSANFSVTGMSRTSIQEALLWRRCQQQQDGEKNVKEISLSLATFGLEAEVAPYCHVEQPSNNKISATYLRFVDAAYKEYQINKWSHVLLCKSIYQRQESLWQYDKTCFVMLH